MESTDASYYTDNISRLEKEQTEFLGLSKEQINVVKLKLRSSNMTSQDVYDNERVLSRELEEIAVSSMTFVVNEHTAQLVRALGECRGYYEILIASILNAQKGILQPHIISSMQLMNQIKSNQADIPSDLMLPVPMSAAFQHFIIRITEIDVFLRISILLCNSCTLHEQYRDVFGRMPSLLGNRKLNTYMDTLITRYCRVTWLPSNRGRMFPLR
jgi:hypothetical protein